MVPVTTVQQQVAKTKKFKTNRSFKPSENKYINLKR